MDKCQPFPPLFFLNRLLLEASININKVYTLSTWKSVSTHSATFQIVLLNVFLNLLEKIFSYAFFFSGRWRMFWAYSFFSPFKKKWHSLIIANVRLHNQIYKRLPYQAITRINLRIFVLSYYIKTIVITIFKNLSRYLNIHISLVLSL